MTETPGSMVRGRSATVRRYAPGFSQDRHTDRHSRVSLILRGGLCEEGRSAALRLGPGDVLLKARNVEHADRFGDEGAVILSLLFVADDPFDAVATRWGKRDDPASVRLATAMMEAAAARDALGLDAIATDLVADAGEGARRSSPPPWLLRLRAELEGVGLAAVDVAARARDAGVHAAHASRLFRRCFGVSITEHAQAHAVRRAAALLARPDAALSDVAVAAGFYDQSHMTRVFRRVGGQAPGRVRALSARLTALAGPAVG